MYNDELNARATCYLEAYLGSTNYGGKARRIAASMEVACVVYSCLLGKGWTWSYSPISHNGERSLVTIPISLHEVCIYTDTGSRE
jgi:hypothetical protein